MSRTRTLLSLLILAGLLVGLVPGFLGAQELVPTATMPDDNLVVRLY